jgi:hypothetical protein
MRRKLWEVNIISSAENYVKGKGEVKYSFVFLVPQIRLSLPIKKKNKRDAPSLSYLRRQLFSLPAHEQPSNFFSYI